MHIFMSSYTYFKMEVETMPEKTQNEKTTQVTENVEFGTEYNIREVTRDQDERKRKRNVTLDPREGRFKK